MMRQWRWSQNPRVVVIVIGNLVFVAVVTLRLIGGLEPAELAAYDLFLRLRPDEALPDQRIVLIGATEEDIQRWDWPLSDGVLADLLERVLVHKPRVIGLDIYRDHPVLEGGDRFNEVLAANENIVAVMKYGGEGTGAHVAPPAVLADSAQIGVANMPNDSGGVMRRGFLFLDDGNTMFYSFALRLALQYLSAFGIAPGPGAPNPAHIRLGDITVPPFEANDGGYVDADALGYQFLLDFAGAPRTFPRYSVSQALTNKIPAKAIRDKIVIIGTTADSVKDYFYTPFSRSEDPQQRMYGIALHAHIASQLLRTALAGARPMAVMSELKEGAWIWIWTLAGGLIGLWVRSAWRFALFAAAGVATLVTVCYLAFLYPLWLPVVPPALGWLVAAALATSYLYSQETAQRGQLMQLFSRYLPRDVAESLWQQREQFLQGGRPRPQKLTATVFFSDLKGFTSVSERLDPQALMDWLNEYMETMAQLVMAHGGVVDKFIGDAIMAVFGVPLARASEAEIKQDAINAVECALAMQTALQTLNAQWRDQGLPLIGIRIGIFTGPLVAGSLGSEERLEYTAIGDTVNVASRLESFDKDLASPDTASSRCRILIGESTMQYVEGRYQTERVGAVQLKGKQERITVYRVIRQQNNSGSTLPTQERVS